MSTATRRPRRSTAACALVGAALLGWALPLSAQIPSLPGTAPSTSQPAAAGNPRTQAGAFAESLRQQALGVLRGPSGTGSGQPVTATPLGGAVGMPTTSPTPTSTASGPTMSGLASGTGQNGLMHYDPMFDNHLTAPADAIGLFGVAIGTVEKRVRSCGGRMNSYVFGKSCRMVLSIYNVNMFFDKFRRLGRVSITPRPPFTQVEPQAQAFFTKLFLGENPPPQFGLSVRPGEFVIDYRP